MRTTPELLAAVAAAAVPGLAPVATGPSPDDVADFRSCVVQDAAGKRWRVRSPLSTEASMRLETEHLVLQAFTPSVRSHLPFHLPTVAGSVARGGVRTFVYSHLPGQTLSLAELQRQNTDPEPPRHAPSPSAAPRAPLAVQLGRALGALHSLPRALVMDADLPAYGAEECRRRMLHDLDRAAATGRIPGELLRRWEEAMEDVTLWQFSTRVVHGDLHEDNITVDHGTLVSFTGWSDLHVGDPAEDFTWLVGMSDPVFADTVIETYSLAAVQAPDRHLLRRAHLKAEFALAEWLVRGVDRGIPSMVDNAERMLTTLAQDVRASASPSPGVPGARRAAGAECPPDAAEDPGSRSTPTGSTAVRGAAARNAGQDSGTTPPAAGAAPDSGVAPDPDAAAPRA
ncbi:macrolide 2'-phosphotransferase [Kocuria sp.]|uniref:macrolide 2'-phosphotransferase n=1 Tax=Kocuria sp. TaxID=1871328 RepID=UPI0026DCD465|nr:macrolide 2'-phosphotransferase [Kocuria sp.]MDO4918890.1 macrolide 2'-phosphotransferase [Kocuria sp.]